MQGFDQLQVLLGAEVHIKDAVLIFNGYGLQMSQHVFLGRFKIIQHPPVGDPVRISGQVLAEREIFFPDLCLIAVGNHDLHFPQHPDYPIIKVFSDNNFPGIIFQEVLGKGRRSMSDILDEVLAGADFGHDDGIAVAIVFYRRQIDRLLLIADLIDDSSRRDDADDIAFHEADCFFRVLHLLDDRDLVSALHESLDIGSDRMMRNSAHRNPVFHAGILACQDQVQLSAGGLGIIEEHLIEIADPVEYQSIRVILLHFEILLHHRGISFCLFCHVVFSSFLRVSLYQSNERRKKDPCARTDLWIS